MFSTASEVTRLTFSFVCLRNRTFVLVVKAISYGVAFFFYHRSFIFCVLSLHTKHVRQGNEKVISNTILTAPPHIKTHKSTEQKTKNIRFNVHHSFKHTFILFLISRKLAFISIYENFKTVVVTGICFTLWETCLNYFQL